MWRGEVLGRIMACLVSGVWVLLLLAAVFGVVLNVPVVLGSGTIYIRADGSIDPPTAPISTIDNVTYTFTDDINDTIVIERSSIIIDGNGCTLRRSSGERGKGGFYLSGPSNVTIKNTNIRGPGVQINTRNGSDKITISQNNITNCGDAILLDGGSNNNVISDNNIVNNSRGILLWEGTENNRICRNNIVNNTCGIHVGDCYGDTVVYHNNFVDNTNHVVFYYGSVIWDDGYPSGGNYWDDHVGVDANGDGIGDAPYTIDSYNHDRYPLMNRWAPSEHEPVTPSEVQAGVKAGDWTRLDYTISGAPSGTLLPQWIKIEFLSVEGTTANVRVTMHMSDGTEPSQTLTVDVAVGSGAFQGLSGFVIPANCTTGDSVYISGYGNVTIAGETTRPYAGASRTAVYASFSPLESQLTYYWDKQTGVMVEASATLRDGMTVTAKATETNMWQAQSSGLPFDQTYLYVLVVVVIAIAVGSIVFVMRRKKKLPEAVTSTAPTLQTTP